jgi:oligopeptide/dipeptide ABC transporter ATP-binding protein
MVGMNTLLEIQDLRIGLSANRQEERGEILRGITLDIHEGERVALVGESGCGKSMTALSIMRLLPEPPMVWNGGRIQYRGKNLDHLSSSGWRNVRGREIGMVFQEPFTSLNPVKRVGPQVMEGILTHQEVAENEAKARVIGLLNEVGLSDPTRVFQQYPHQLSGGMCQRVMIAMAISCAPSLLIADEPTTALDVTVQRQILDLLALMSERHQMAILFITHNLRLAQSYSDRIAILYAGQVVEVGRPEDIFSRPQHPYTECLLAAMPNVEHRGKNLYTILGNVPKPQDRILGCAFAPRCQRVQNSCSEMEPRLEQWKGEQWVRCFYPSKM